MVSEIRQLAEEKGLILIEDAAGALGAKLNGRMVGAFGESAIFSFAPNKLVTTGEGGAVVTDSDLVYENLKLIRSHGRAESSDYFSSRSPMDYVRLGFNFRMSTMTAALGLSQIRKVEQLIAMRNEKAAYLSSRLSELERVIPPRTVEGRRHTYQMYTVRLPDGEKTKDSLSEYLARQGVASKVWFHPVHLTRFYSENWKVPRGSLPVTERIGGEVLSLPFYPTISGDEMDYVVDCAASFLKAA